MSLALAGEFSTTGPPGKSSGFYFVTTYQVLAVPILVLRLENLDSIQFTVLLSVQMLQEDTHHLALHPAPAWLRVEPFPSPGQWPPPPQLLLVSLSLVHSPPPIRTQALPTCHLRTSRSPRLGQGTGHPSQPLRAHMSLTPEPTCWYTAAQHFSAHPTVVPLHQTSHTKPSSNIRSLRISRQQQQQTIKSSMSPCWERSPVHGPTPVTYHRATLYVNTVSGIRHTPERVGFRSELSRETGVAKRLLLGQQSCQWRHDVSGVDRTSTPLHLEWWDGSRNASIKSTRENHSGRHSRKCTPRAHFSRSSDILWAIYYLFILLLTKLYFKIDNPNLPIHPIPSFSPWCPYICSLCLCLCFCFVNKFVCTIFLDSTYMH